MVLHDNVLVNASQDLTAKVQQLEALQPREVEASHLNVLLLGKSFVPWPSPAP